jgi:tRNA (guanine-N7-)-methyltransferase
MRKFQPDRIPKPRVTLPEGFFRDLGNTKPLDIEIGCGVGLHPVHYCLKNPDRTLVAIDRSAMRMGKMMDRIAENGGVSNLVPIRENAIWFLTHEIPSNCVENYFFMYPNPYPKKKQANMRWPNMPFMEHVLSTLKGKGKITFATNMKFYAEETEEAMTSEWGMKLIKKEVYSSLEEIPFEPRTHFEKKYLQRGETCWNLVFEK